VLKYCCLYYESIVLGSKIEIRALVDGIKLGNKLRIRDFL